MLNSSICVCFDDDTSPVYGSLFEATPTGFWFMGKEILDKFPARTFTASHDDPKAVTVFVPANRIKYMLSMRD
jgi:hypothetical protein